VKGYAPKFIQSRIEWRAGQHGLPYERTDYWGNAPDNLRSRLPSSFERPVVFSMAEGGDATIIGTDEVAIVDRDGVSRFSLDNITELSSPNIAERKQKVDFDAVSVKASANTYRLPAEKGKACFAVWNILLTLSRMCLMLNVLFKDVAEDKDTVDSEHYSCALRWQLLGHVFPWLL